MRVAATIALSDETRLRLEKPARGRSTPVRIVPRSRTVLLAGNGLQNKQIAERMEVATRMVALWRNRSQRWPLGNSHLRRVSRGLHRS